MEKLFAKTLKFFVRLIKKSWNWNNCRQDPIVIYPVKKVEGKTARFYTLSEHNRGRLISFTYIYIYITYKIFLNLVCLDRKQKTMSFHFIIKELITRRRFCLFLSSLWPLRTGPHLFSESESFTTWWTNTGPLKNVANCTTTQNQILVQMLLWSKKI